MKTRIWQTLILAATVPLLLMLITARTHGADDSKSDATVPAVNNAPANNPTADSPVPPAAPVPAASAASNSTPAGVVRLPKPGLPPLLDQVARLSQSGADEKIVKAYIDKAAPPYRITGNEIIQLRDMGVSQDVILALIEHSKSAGPENIVPAGAEPPAPAAVPPETNTVAAPAATDAAADFYDSLSPYGSWMNLPDYGWCWQPTVVVVNPGWQPYCNYGGWLWSDYGWYWNSYYSWGWGPFHYGRWCSYPNTGWVWCPGQTWGPAWVCWQNSPGYCGWAALPPHCNYAAGVGWTWNGKSVNANCGFGLNSSSYTYVAHDNFAARNVGAYSLRGAEANAAYRNATMVNNYSMGANNRLVNQGISREAVAAASRTPIRDVTVRESSRGGNQSAVPGRVSQAGNASVAYRSGTQISGPRTTVIQNSPGRASVARSSGSPAAAVNQRASINPGSSSRSSRAASPATQRVTPNYSRSYTTGGSVQRVYRSSGVTTAAPRAQSPVYARPAGSVSSAARASVSGQRSFAPSTAGRAMPSGGGAQFRGSFSRGSSASAPSFGARR